MIYIFLQLIIDHYVVSFFYLTIVFILESFVWLVLLLQLPGAILIPLNIHGMLGVCLEGGCAFRTQTLGNLSADEWYSVPTLLVVLAWGGHKHCRLQAVRRSQVLDFKMVTYTSSRWCIFLGLHHQCLLLMMSHSQPAPPKRAFNICRRRISTGSQESPAALWNLAWNLVCTVKRASVPQTRAAHAQTRLVFKARCTGDAPNTGPRLRAWWEAQNSLCRHQI